MSVIGITTVGIGILFLILAALVGVTIILGKFCRLTEKLKLAKTEEKTIGKEKVVAISSAVIASYLSKKPAEIMMSSIQKISPK
ncbi:MAG: hypothetical protein U9O41_00060 [Candidatus Aerophobetes bacterium]|nr:hypothetical protein [Candidatus Aerophobetes bacterium]